MQTKITLFATSLLFLFNSCASFEKSYIEIEYSKIESLKKPNDLSTIKKIVILPSCTAQANVKTIPIPKWIYTLENLEELYIGTEHEYSGRQDCDLSMSFPSQDFTKLGKLRVFMVDEAFDKQSNTILRDLKMPRSLEVIALIRVDLKFLPKWVLEQKKLKRLTLQYGKLTNLPKNISTLQSLEYLDLFMNDIKTLPKEMAKIQSLNVIKLGNNKITKKQQSTMRKLLPHVKFDFTDEYDVHSNEE